MLTTISQRCRTIPQRTIDLSLAVLASVVSFLLSWPFWRAYEYWPESRIAWWLYFAIGFVLAIYVFYMFIHSLRALSAHELPGHDDDGESES